jgi:hypothetical protein
VAKDESFVSYSTSGSGTNVQVATSGAVSINVSTINGDIAVGDQLTASPIEGFAMKAKGSGKVIGRSLANFTRSTNGAQIRTVNDAQGKPTEVGIGQVALTIEIADWSGPTGLQNAFVENLKTLGGQIAGKQVSASNAVIAAMVLAIAVLVSGIVLFSSVSASMNSLGRNPLSHRVIREDRLVEGIKDFPCHPFHKLVFEGRYRNRSCFSVGLWNKNFSLRIWSVGALVYSCHQVPEVYLKILFVFLFLYAVDSNSLRSVEASECRTKIFHRKVAKQVIKLL